MSVWYFGPHALCHTNLKKRKIYGEVLRLQRIPLKATTVVVVMPSYAM
jgi:hypothetical protein